MADVKFPTPAELRALAAAEDVKQADLFRDKLFALVSQSQGQTFLYCAGDMPKREGAVQILLEELRQSNWRPRLESNGLDGDFYRVFPKVDE